jgi:uncharacterized protein with PQ loop repeat
MTMLPADGSCVESAGKAATTPLERVLRAMSVATMLMTVPQVLSIWVGHDAGGVSLLSWGSYLFSALLWFYYGVQKGDRTIYLACIGWIVLDLAIVAGAVVYR